MTDESNINEIGHWDPNLRFDPQEACSLLNHEVINASDRETLPKPPIDKLGIIVGVLALNDEIEIIIRIDDALRQICKTEFCADYILVTDT